MFLSFFNMWESLPEERRTNDQFFIANYFLFFSLFVLVTTFYNFFSQNWQLVPLFKHSFSEFFNFPYYLSVVKLFVHSLQKYQFIEQKLEVSVFSSRLIFSLDCGSTFGKIFYSHFFWFQWNFYIKVFSEKKWFKISLIYLVKILHREQSFFHQLQYL